MLKKIWPCLKIVTFTRKKKKKGVKFYSWFCSVRLKRCEVQRYYWKHFSDCIIVIRGSIFFFLSLRTFILNALLKPLAKNPPKGPMTELNTAMDKEWSMKGYSITVFFTPIWNTTNNNIETVSSIGIRSEGRKDFTLTYFGNIYGCESQNHYLIIIWYFLRRFRIGEAMHPT